MKEIGERLRSLRKGAMLSQAKLAKELGTTQSGLNRYENGQSTPPVSLFRAYADFFDVSMDYIFARTDKPQGKNYKYTPKKTSDDAQLQQFIEMCFDPTSPVSTKMKETLFKMMTGGDGE